MRAPAKSPPAPPFSAKMRNEKMQAAKKSPKAESAPPAQNHETPEKKKRKLHNILLDIAIAFCLTGIVSLVLSRPIGVRISDRQHEDAIDEYIAAVNALSDEELENIKARAVEYNKNYALVRPYIWAEPFGEFKLDYPSELSVPGTDVIGYIEIPSIDVRLPIYHYSSDENMSRGCGHSECTSLPVGGTDGHYVLFSHRNMVTAVTFEHLDRLKEGDTFSVTVLKDTATFEVDNIRVVDPKCPEEYADDKVEEGKELCTLVTCTPNITNTHRLFVRGTRVD